MDVHLLDGTYELFRYYFALPSYVNKEGREVAATRGVLGTVLSMLEGGVTHLGVATDKVIESFRNEMWPGYKSSAGVEPQILQQFPLIEEGLQALGVKLWPMVELEADDALGSAALKAASLPEVRLVYICSPDKDLGQCVKDGRIIQLERRTGKLIDEAGAIAKFGVPPASIADYLALVGDSPDGYPGLPGWGSKSAAAVLQSFGTIEAIPDEASAWGLPVRGADKLALVLREQRSLALLFKDIATLRTDAPVFEDVEELHWRGPNEDFASMCHYLESPVLLERAQILARQRARGA